MEVAQSAVESRPCALTGCERTVSTKGKRFCSSAHRRRAWGLRKEGTPVLTQAERVVRLARIQAALDTLSAEVRGLMAAEVAFEATPSVGTSTEAPRS